MKWDLSPQRKLLTPTVGDFVAQNHNHKTFLHKTLDFGVNTCTKHITMD